MPVKELRKTDAITLETLQSPKPRFFAREIHETGERKPKISEFYFISRFLRVSRAFF